MSSQIIKMSILFIGQRRPFITSSLIMSSDREFEQAQKRRKQQIYRQQLLLQIREKKQKARREKEHLAQANPRYLLYNKPKVSDHFRRELVATANQQSPEEIQNRPRFIDYFGQSKRHTIESSFPAPLSNNKPIDSLTPLRFDSFTPLKFDFSHLNQREAHSRVKTESIYERGTNKNFEMGSEERRHQLRSYENKKFEQVYKKMQESVQALNSQDDFSPLANSRWREPKYRRQQLSRFRQKGKNNPEEWDPYQLPARLKQSHRKAEGEEMSWKERFARLKLRQLEDYYQDALIHKHTHEIGERAQTPSFHSRV